MAEKFSEDQATKEKIRKCKVCKIKCPDDASYIEHLESKDHKKETMKEKYGKKYLEAKAKLDDKINNDEKATSEAKHLISDKSVSEDKDTDEDSDVEVFTCEICDKICTGFVSYQMHLKGKKHQKSLRRGKLMTHLKESNLIPKTVGEKSPEETSLLDRFMTKTEFASSPIECETCNTKCSGPESFKQHCKGEKHKKKLAMQGLMDQLGISNGISDSSVFASCEICQKDFSGPLIYQQHMESNAHMREVRNVEKLSKIKDLVICSEEDRKLQCKTCSKVFSGPIPFNDHLNSSIHAKLEKKNAQMKELEEKHPDVVKVPIGDNPDNAEDGAFSLLGCIVCRVVFSGPQSARDHFESAKHKKAVKSKSLIEKFAKLPGGKTHRNVSTAEVSSETIKGIKEDDKSPDYDDGFEIIQDKIKIHACL